MIDGTWDPAFGEVADLLDRQLTGAGRGGAAVSVYWRGTKVVDVWGGFFDNEGTPWREDTMCMSFSTTKGVTATALHICIDRGLLDYDDLVSKHWPEFARDGKETITVRHVLADEAGLYDVVSMLDSPEQLLDWGAMIAAIERSRPAFEPGTANAYHAVTFGYLVGELIARVSGRGISEFVQTEIAAPLGLDGCFIGLPAAELHRVSPMMLSAGASITAGSGALGELAAAMGYELSPERVEAALAVEVARDIMLDPASLAHPIPAANGVFTARSLARMYAALAADGELDGVRLLSPETLARATEVQNDRPDLVIVFPMHWRLGYHLVFTAAGELPNGFGHSGLGGSGGWADPDRQLAVAMTVNRMGNSISADDRFLTIGGAAVQVVDAQS